MKKKGRMRKPSQIFKSKYLKFLLKKLSKKKEMQDEENKTHSDSCSGIPNSGVLR